MTDRVMLNLTQHEHSGEAYRLSNTGKIRDAKWIPKKFCEKLAEGKFAIETWKAREIGFTLAGDADQGSLL